MYKRQTLYSCGAFYLSDYESLETWIMKKNPENYDADNVFIDTISRIYNAEAAVNGPEMIKRGEIDEATIGSDILDSWLADDTTKDMVSMDRPNTNYTYFYMFNFMPFAHEFSNWNVEGVDAEYEPENWAKAINSTNFRKAFLYLSLIHIWRSAFQKRRGWAGRRFRGHSRRAPEGKCDKIPRCHTKP